MQLPEEERKQQFADMIQVNKKLDHSSRDHVSINNLVATDPVHLMLSDNFDLGMINNVSILVGDSPTNITMQQLLTNDYLDNCKNETVAVPSKTHFSLTFSDRRCSNMFFEILMFFHQCQGTDLYPFIREDVDMCNESFLNMKMIKNAMVPKDKRICPHCGLKEDQFIAQFADHKFNCALDHQSCDCNLTFKTPGEKRRHALLVHSGKNYITCPHCPLLLLKKAAVEKHIVTKHGGSNESSRTCDLCHRICQSVNHLRIHRFNHEIYLCLKCGKEIKGRNSHKVHMMKVHSAVCPCDMCDKVMYTERQLEKHKRDQHSNVWKT